MLHKQNTSIRNLIINNILEPNLEIMNNSKLIHSENKQIVSNMIILNYYNLIINEFIDSNINQ